MLERRKVANQLTKLTAHWMAQLLSHDPDVCQKSFLPWLGMKATNLGDVLVYDNVVSDSDPETGAITQRQLDFDCDLNSSPYQLDAVRYTEQEFENRYGAMCAAGLMIAAPFNDYDDEEEMTKLIDGWVEQSLMSSSKQLQDDTSLWLLDSGASFHMIRQQDVVESWSRVKTVRNPPQVQTANGLRELDKEVRAYTPEIDANLHCYVLPDTASVVAPGKLIKQQGCSWLWVGPSKKSKKGAFRFFDGKGKKDAYCHQARLPISGVW